MSRRPLVRRRAARLDIEAASDYYLAQAGGAVAAAFLSAIETAFRRIADNPGAGSTYFAHLAGAAGLRSRLLVRYPYVVLYVETDDTIDVVRVLHQRQDIASIMTPATPD